jgi:type II secretory pathway pseudopilin PulG
MTPPRSRRSLSSLFWSAFWPARSGETSNTTVIVIIICVVAGFGLFLCVPIMIALLLPAVQQAREAARRTQSKNNLHMMGLAMHNFHDVQQHWVPGGTYAEDGTPLHSWQTHLLPYMEQAPLYQSINLEIPWNDPANASNFYITIAPYTHPSQTQMTTSEGFAATHYAGNQHVLIQNSELTIRDVTDGTSNTIVAGEVAGGFRAWGDPANVRDPGLGINGNPQGFGSSSPGGCHFLLMDGSVRFVSENIAPGVLKGLATPAGGENIGEF